MSRKKITLVGLSLAVLSMAAATAYFAASCAASDGSLVRDASFEEPMEKNRFGHVFRHWAGWIYDGECEFRVSDVARTGKHSLVMVAGANARIRAWPAQFTLSPGRYRITAYLRGLDIGQGMWGQTTEFMFEEKYIPLKKNGTFGWTKLTYVGDVKQRREYAHPSFGLIAPGYLWVDDVSVEAVGPDVELTPEPILGPEEGPVAPPSPVGAQFVRCPDCGYRNNGSWQRCYACGAGLNDKKVVVGAPVKAITSFEEDNPFSGGTVVADHATDGKKALRIDKNFASMDAAQDWTGYDYLKVDVHTDAKKPLPLEVEVRDRQTRDYWTRVNYTTVIPPGKSTLIVPTALYVGEKSRPGRPLMLNAITRLVFAIGERPEGSLTIDNLRLDRDGQTDKVKFDGLWAFDVGPAGSPVMEGFTPLDVTKTYHPARGFGWKDAQFWRAFNSLQPDPLYQDFICVEKGGLAIDVPNGKYHVFVNMDSPSGYWGEYQKYRSRAIVIEGKRAEDRLDLEAFKKLYFRNWDREDLPTDNVFDTYQIPYFREKFFAVDVKDGQLNIDFEGENWACCVSAIIVYPALKDAEGKDFLRFVQERRRFHFDNTFKRVVNTPTGPPLQPSEAERLRGFVVFARDPMKDVHHNDRPEAGEKVERLQASAFAGESEAVTVSVAPLRDLGSVRCAVSNLRGPGGAVLLPDSIDIGYVQHRLSRVTMEGSVYTIAPKWIVPRSSARVPTNVTRTFWLTVKAPPASPPGVYKGEVHLTSERGGECAVPIEFTVRKGTLDPVDVPAGPWGHSIELPWYDECVEWNFAMVVKSLRKLREYGFTSASGLPVVTYQGFKGGVPQFDFTRADTQMQVFKDLGFTMPVVTYCPLHGLNLYNRDEEAMRAAGFTDYSKFLREVFGAIQRHADKAGWLPVYWNIGDEPVTDELVRAAENAEAYRQAFPKGPPSFTAASSFKGSNRSDPHFRLSKALHVANWNDHDAASVNLLHEAGGDWAFYNGGNRWTYGAYMFKAAKQHGMKFRLSWHWNNVAGDPYYALDCREDDYAWCNTNAEGELIPAVHFERLRLGLGDYRRFLTLSRLAEKNAGTPAAAEANKVLADILGRITLGDREVGPERFVEIRTKLDAAIEKLR